MKQLSSLGEMAMELALRVPMIAIELHAGLDVIARKIEKDAKAEIGTYQDAVGPFPGWSELADATKDDRIRQGYSENDPLLRSGQRMDDITHAVEGLEAAIGTPQSALTAQIAVYEEFGTTKEPARPVLGPAAFKNKTTIQKLVGAAAVAGLIGHDRIHEALGYDFKTED